MLGRLLSALLLIVSCQSYAVDSSFYQLELQNITQLADEGDIQAAKNSLTTLLKTALKNQNYEIARELGLFVYLRKDGRFYDPAGAKKIFDKAVSDGCGLCNAVLAQIYAEQRDGIEGTPNAKQAFRYVQDAAEAGSGLAHLTLGRVYASGSFLGEGGYPKDLKISEYHLVTSVDLGTYTAVEALALEYIYGFVYERDLGKALTLLERVLYKDAERFIGIQKEVRNLYAVLIFDELPEDAVSEELRLRAIEQFKKAADEGHVLANWSLSLMYGEDLPVEDRRPGTEYAMEAYRLADGDAKSEMAANLLVRILYFDRPYAQLIGNEKLKEILDRALLLEKHANYFWLVLSGSEMLTKDGLMGFDWVKGHRLLEIAALHGQDLAFTNLSLFYANEGYEFIRSNRERIDSMIEVLSRQESLDALVFVGSQVARAAAVSQPPDRQMFDDGIYILKSAERLGSEMSAARLPSLYFHMSNPTQIAELKYSIREFEEIENGRLPRPSEYQTGLLEKARDELAIKLNREFSDKEAKKTLFVTGLEYASSFDDGFDIGNKSEEGMRVIFDEGDLEAGLSLLKFYSGQYDYTIDTSQPANINAQKSLEIYQRISNRSIEAGDVIADGVMTGKIGLPMWALVNVYKKSLMLLMMTGMAEDSAKFASVSSRDEGRDHYTYTNLINLATQGLQVSIIDGDLYSAEYFIRLMHDARKHIRLLPEELARHDLVMMGAESIYLLEKGEKDKAVQIAKTLFKKIDTFLDQPKLDEWDVAHALRLVYTAAEVVGANKEYELIVEELIRFLNRGLLMPLPQTLLSIQGKVYAYYGGNKNQVDQMEKYRTVSDLVILHDNPKNFRMVSAVNMLEWINGGGEKWKDKSDSEWFDHVDEALRSFVDLNIRGSGERIRHWEIEYVEHLASIATNAGSAYGQQWMELARELYVDSVRKRLNEGKIVTPLEKDVASTYVYEFMKDHPAGSNDSFELFQLFQSLAAARAVDLKDTDVKSILSTSNSSSKSAKLRSLDALSRTFGSVTSVPVVDVQQVAQALDEHEVLIGFLPTNKGTISWMISENQSDVKISSLSKGRIEAIVQSVLDSVQHGADFPYEDAHQLYSDLIGNFAIGPDIKKIIFSPGAELSLMPLTLLPVRTGSEMSSANQSDRAIRQRGLTVNKTNSVGRRAEVRWLIEDYEVAVLPSIRSILSLKGNNDRDLKSFLAIGNPILPRNELEIDSSSLALLRGGGFFTSDDVHRSLIALPETDDEMRSLSSNFEISKILSGEEATEVALMSEDLKSFDVISFATHALKYDQLSGSNEAALVLTKSADGDTDGLLTQSEVLEMELPRAQLVMLSACNTASADAGLKTEGFTGLATSFMAAGARNVLVSHWSVISEAAKELTTGMFVHGEGSISARLRTSILRLLDSRDPLKQSPAYWAPFTVLGPG